MTDRSYQKVVRLLANERFRCADNVAALICLLPYPSLALSLHTSLYPFALHISPHHVGWPRPAYFVFFGAWHLPRLQQSSSSPAPIRECLPPSPPLPARRIPAIPAPILIAIANRCQNASMQSAALRSCCLLPSLPSSSTPPLFLFTCCCSCCSLCSLFLLLLLLPSCSCCSLTNCVASSLDKPQEEPVATWLP